MAITVIQPPPTAPLAIEITASMWSDGSSAWPDGNTPLGGPGSSCYLATVTQDVNGAAIPCADGDDFKVNEYSVARCPAPLWVYIGDGTVYVATTNPPTSSITIRGLILRNVS